MGRPNKLSAARWIDTGLSVLASQGAEGLKADTLAKMLNVTRGSFYHHFENVTDFHVAVISRWRETALREFDGLVAPTRGTATDLCRKLQPVLQLFLNRPNPQEYRIRLWAQTSTLPRVALHFVDSQRLDFVTALLLESGLPRDVASLRSGLLYSCLLGETLREGPTPQSDEAVVRELCRWAFDRQQSYSA